MADALQNARSLFLVAVERAPAERAEFLDEACGGDAGLRKRVEALLHAHDEPGAFLSAAKPDPNATATEVPSYPLVGTTIAGRYKLIEQIGDGGMGTVWMAEQREPVKRLVAVKLIKAGMDSKAVLARFEAERQALAMMDHPSIAKVLDGGATDDGRPYVVMELVKGLPLTEYCDARRLTVRDRLDLFRQICSAVQHAHQKAVIHRDLKPSNILVTEHDGKPVPKVIDFGLAKALNATNLLTERTLHTAYGTVVGTPLYMAPEQVAINALDVDTRTDVYALGVILYELLAGSTPLEKARFKEAAWEEVKRLIREAEPPRPSTRLSSSASLPSLAASRQAEPAQLSRLVRGELDWIVMKALEKDRSRRYDTAAGLSRDVERYLRDEPVEAYPPSARYRLYKFLRKHRAGALTAVAFVTLLLTGVVVSAWQSVRATRAEADALSAANAEKQAKEDAQAAERGEVAQKKNAEAQSARAIQEAERSRRLLYASDLNLAHHAWDAGDTARARALLDRHWPQDGQDDLRGFEWRYLWRLCKDGSRMTLHGQEAFITTVAFAPDGKYLATCSSDNVVCIWDLGAQRQFKVLGYKAQSVTFAPDGKTLALLEQSSRSICLWDVAGRRERASIPQPSRAMRLAFSPDGKHIATGEWSGTVRLWDVALRQEIGALGQHEGPVSGVVFSPDGTILASCSAANGPIRLWDTAQRRGIGSLDGHTSGVLSLAFSPDGKTIASAGVDSTVRLWNTASSQVVSTFRGQGKAVVVSVAYSPDGKTLATGAEDGAVRLWDAVNKNVTAILRGHKASVYAVAFAPDGRSLVSGGSDGAVKVWDLVPAENPNILPGSKGTYVSLAFSPDGKSLAVTDSLEQAVTLWDIASRKPAGVLKGHSKPVYCANFAPDGLILASADFGGTIRLWDIRAKQCLADLQTNFDGVIWSTAFSPDGKLLAVGAGEVQVWDVAARRKVRQLTKASAVQFSPDGTMLAVNSGNTVRLWSVATWEIVAEFTGQAAEVQCFAFAPDGRALAVGESNGDLRLWDVALRKEIAGRRGHTSTIRSVVFSPDGRRLATCGPESAITIWDLDPLQEVANLTGHEGPVFCAAFSPDGNTLATASADATVRLWPAPPVPAGPPQLAEAISRTVPVESLRMLTLELNGTARANLTAEEDVCRVDVTSVDGTDWHAKLRQVLDNLQDDSTYTVRFRAKADAERRIKLEAQSPQPNWHLIGLNDVVPMTKEWKSFEYTFRAQAPAGLNRIQFLLGERTGTVWIADFAVTKVSFAQEMRKAKEP
jgi:eukaryotic-like serine/threonine-protein kinase